MESKLKKDLINMTLHVSLMNSNHTYIEILRTLEMGSLKNFKTFSNMTENIEICSEDENNNEKIYLIISSIKNETSLIKFEIFDQSEHPKIVFYMKKIAEIIPIPEMDVLMTIDRNRVHDHDYEYTLVSKSVVNPKIPIINEDEAFFYISSEIGEQMLIYPKFFYNDSGIIGHNSGSDSYG